MFNGEQAAKLLLRGDLPPNSIVKGEIRAYSESVLEIPQGLVADALDLGSAKLKFNPGLKAQRLSLYRADFQTGLPSDLVCEQLSAHESNLREIPDGAVVSQRLNLANCSQLVRLPSGLKTGSLILRNCTALETLPEGLDVYFLDISDCRRIRAFPTRGAIHSGRLSARNCINLEALPAWLDVLSGLDLQNCSRINRLPENLYINEWLDLAGTGIRALPPHLESVNLRWRGVPVDKRIVFQPETLTADDILQAQNIEVRRVMLERMGLERFIELSKANTLNVDRDAGGERKLLKVKMPSDEDLVCVCFSCPSTGRKYVVRVPPKTKTARAAVAWIAGFDNPDDYKPDLES